MRTGKGAHVLGDKDRSAEETDPQGLCYAICYGAVFFCP